VRILGEQLPTIQTTFGRPTSTGWTCDHRVDPREMLRGSAEGVRTPPAAVPPSEYRAIAPSVDAAELTIVTTP
jgi:hypothetical protein